MSLPSQYLLAARSHQRKLSLQRLLSSTDIARTKNGIRNIIQQSVVRPYQSVGNNYQRSGNSYQRTGNNINNNKYSSSLVQSKLVKQSPQKYLINNNFIIPNINSNENEPKDNLQSTETNQYQANNLQIQKLNDTQQNILSQIKQIKQQLSNMQKPKQQQIIFNSQQFNTWQQWMGKVFGEIFQRAYQLFSTQKLTYNQMRAFCCQNILLNLIQFQRQQQQRNNVKLKTNDNNKCKDDNNNFNNTNINTNQSQQQTLQSLPVQSPPQPSPQPQLSANPLPQSCSSWQSQALKIMQHQCNKYPQIQQKFQVNKKLEQIVKKNQIDNLQNDDYDFVDRTGVVFKYKQSGDYTEEIMMFLNEVLTVCDKGLMQMGRVTNGSTQNKNINSSINSNKSNINNSNNTNRTLFNNFHIFFTNVFNIVNHKTTTMDMDILLNSTLNDNQYYKFNKLTNQQDRQYYEKVQSYTKIQIGTKIPLNSPTYSFDQILSGNIQIKNKQLFRVIEKWIEQLKLKLLHPQKHILQKIHRFKSNHKGQKIKLSSKEKQLLVNKLTQQRSNILQFKQKIKQNIQQLTQQLMSSLGNLQQLTFMEQNQRAMGEFACKMEQASVEYSVQQLNQVIGALLKAVQKMKEQQTKTMQNYNKFIDQEVNLNLITFKLGDLIRCKFTSHQEEVIRVFQFLLTMSEMSYQNNIFKIIRIKNRLHLSTRDILINALFKQTIVCQVQLAVNESVSYKQKLMDKFNHFLYELKRSEMGVLLELSNVWVNNCPKSITFKKYIKQENLNKKALRQNICKYTIFELTESNHKFYRLPFICNLCKIFYTRQQTVFKTVQFEKYPQPICGECMSQRIQKMQRLKYLFSTQDKPVHLMNYMQKFKLHESIIQIFTLSQINQYQYMIMIPINSRKINKFAIQKITTSEITYLVNNKLLENGKLQMKVMYEFYNRDESIQQQEKEFFSKYCLFTFNKPLEMKPIEIKKSNFNGLLQADLQNIYHFNNVNNQFNSNNALLCLYMKFTQNEYVLLPHYKDLLTDPQQKLKQNLIINKITGSVKSFKDVIQLSNLGLKDQFTRIPQGIKLKINSIIKEIYVDDNELTSIEWVSAVLGLEILSARHNRITYIPKMPINIRMVDMAHNKLTKIQGFTSSNIYINDNQQKGNPNILIGMVMGMKKQCSREDNENTQYCQLRVLNLSHNMISKIQNLQHVSNLRQLSLSHNSISAIENLSYLKKLKKLNLSHNPIRKIDRLDQLLSIEYLAMGDTLINTTKGLDRLYGLCTLIMDNCDLAHKDIDNNNDNSYGYTNIDSSDDNKSNINIADNNNNLQYSKASYSQLDLPSNIKNLNLSNNKLHSMNQMQQLHNLQQLILHTNSITDISLTQSLSNIKLLNLSFNYIQKIPDMKQIIQLKQLYLSHNVIKQVQGLEQNVFLSVLDLSHNQIKELKNIKYLINLNKLYAQNNLIQAIQPFDNIKTLKQLQLANNLITQILFSLPNTIKRINLQNNLLSSIEFISQLVQSKRQSLTSMTSAIISDEESKIDELIIRNNKIPIPMLLTIKHLLNIEGVNIVV